MSEHYVSILGLFNQNTIMGFKQAEQEVSLHK